MTSKIFRSTVFVAVVVLLCSLGIVIGVLYNHFTGVQVQQLKDELSLAVTGTEQYGNAFLENVEANRFRVTWIDTDGTVLFDTQVDQNSMENHADREEIREAFETGSGSAVRNSSTLTEQTYYEARRLQDGTVLRISTNQASAWALMMDLLWPIMLIAVLAICLSAVLARRMATKIVEPLNKLIGLPLELAHLRIDLQVLLIDPAQQRRKLLISIIGKWLFQIQFVQRLHNLGSHLPGKQRRKTDCQYSNIGF